MADQNSNTSLIKKLSELLEQTKTPVNGLWFNKKVIYLDGYHFISCHFDECEIHYTNADFIIENCKFTDCRYSHPSNGVRAIKLFNLNHPEVQTNANFRPTYGGNGTVSIQS